MGVRIGKRLRFKGVILESDCRVIIAHLSKNAFFLSNLDAILHDIIDILASCTSFSSINWSHVQCDGNFVVHHLAKLVPFGNEQIWKTHA